MYRPTRAVVDLQKIKKNTENLRNLVGHGFFCPMVKANAYGHGDTEVVSAIAQVGCERVGVALVEEGLHLRKNGVTKTEILVFGRLTPESAKAAVEFRLVPVLSAWKDLEILSPIGARTIPVQIKIDTGMHRMGFAPEDMPRLREYFSRETKISCVGLCTHLSHGEDVVDDAGRSQKQIQLFREIYSEWGEPLPRHVLNSLGLLAYAKKSRQDAEWLGARPGLAIYGLCESPLVKPAMSLFTALDLVRRVNKNESVSYGGRWTASKDAWIGIVPIGYGDGYFRSFSNKSQMLFRGRRVPVVGTICMDYSLLDLTEACKDAAPNLSEEIVVFGKQNDAEITVMELARLVDTIPYELVTNLSVRVPREYK